MIIEILGLAILCNMLTHWFEPIQGIKFWITDKLPTWLSMPLICSKCAGLWAGLIYFQDLWLGVITSLTAYLIDSLIDIIEDKRKY